MKPGRRITPSRVVHFDSLDSTQSTAFSLAAAGAADGTAVVANYQRLGRGRRGRAWTAPRGTSLLMSIVVRPRLAPADTPLLSLASAVAVARAADRLAGVEARVKWPNDVVVRGRKVAGILLEGRGDPAIVVIGIGVNLAQRAWPEDLAPRATSLLIESGVTVSTDHARDIVLAEFDAWRARLEREGFAPVRDAWLSLADTIGRRVTVDGVEGTAIDLGMDGSLVVDDGSGRRHARAGEIIEAGGAPSLEPSTREG